MDELVDIHRNSRAITIVMNEWNEMFSFVPGRVDGIEPIMQLMKFINKKSTNIKLIDPLAIYKSPYWKEIINLRGPCETVLLNECKSCHSRYHSIGMSGFLDAIGLVCDNCGDVLFKSYYDDNEIPRCSCSGKYIFGCKNCIDQPSKLIKEISPYEYFLNHNYIRGSMI